MKKSILVFSYYTNMPGACQAEWIDDRIFAFIEKGYSIKLVSATCCFTHTHSAIQHYKCPALSPSGARYEYEEIQKREIPVTKGVIYTYTRLMVWLDILLNKLHIRSGEGRWSWFISSTITALWKGDNRKIDFIYTSGGPASAHLSGILLGKLFGKKTICEFQDPLSGDDIGRNRLSQAGLKFFEKQIIAYADCTIYCTQNAMLQARIKYKRHQHKIFYVYPGSVAVENHAQQKPVEEVNILHEKINITYLGSLYQTRNLDTFMKAFTAFVEENNQVVPPVSVNIYGNMNSDIRERILQFPYPGVISMHGLISRDAAMQKALEADILLLIQNIDLRSVATIPFKTYDYLHTGKLILALVYRNDEIEQMMISHGHLVCQADDVMAVKNCIHAILANLPGYQKGIIKSDLTPQKAVTGMLALLQSIPFQA